MLLSSRKDRTKNRFYQDIMYIEIRFHIYLYEISSCIVQKKTLFIVTPNFAKKEREKVVKEKQRQSQQQQQQFRRRSSSSIRRRSYINSIWKLSLYTDGYIHIYLSSYTYDFTTIFVYFVSAWSLLYFVLCFWRWLMMVVQYSFFGWYGWGGRFVSRVKMV